MKQIYTIDGTKNICERELDGAEYNDETFYPQFQEKLVWFKKILTYKYINNEPFVVMRIFDGEFYFLDCQKIGNVGKRHCSIDLTKEFVKKFKEGCYKVDILSTQLYSDKLEQYHRLFPDKDFDLPMEIIYGLFANKWFFNIFNNDIGLIGGSEKIKLIKELMKHPQYKEYLGIEKFAEYIEVPERFTCDDTDELLKNIGEKLSKSQAKVFLYGIGIGKMAISYKFPQYKNAIYIDVGCGLSALAGTTGLDRPYFGGWTNFILENWDYSKMDRMDYNGTKGLNEIIIKNK